MQIIIGAVIIVSTFISLRSNADVYTCKVVRATRSTSEVLGIIKGLDGDKGSPVQKIEDNKDNGFVGCLVVLNNNQGTLQCFFSDNSSTVSAAKTPTGSMFFLGKNINTGEEKVLPTAATSNGSKTLALILPISTKDGILAVVCFGH